MMVVWAGKGWMVGVLGFLCFLGMELVIRGFTASETYYQEHVWPLLLASVIAGMLSRPLALWMEGRNAAGRRVIVDEETGESYEQGFADRSDTLFFIPVWYWQWVWPVIGGLVAIAQLMGIEGTD